MRDVCFMIEEIVRMILLPKLRYNYIKSVLYLTLPALFLIGCSGSSNSNSSSNSIAVASTPSQASGLPDLTNAVPINLSDPVNFTGLNALAETTGVSVFPPLVGNPQINELLSGGNSLNPTGNVVIEYQDQYGVWGSEIPTVLNASYYTSTSLDIIFSSNGYTLRTYGPIVQGTYNGTILYRVRNTGENQCLPQTTYCVPTFLNGFYTTVDPSYCGLPSTTTENEILVQQCQDYITPGAANVGILGTFQVPILNWISN